MMLVGFSSPGLYGLRGLGSFQSDVAAGNCARTGPSFDGKSIECLDSNDNVISSQPITGAGTTPAAASGQPWYDNVIKSLAQGVTAGAMTPGGQQLIPCTAPGVPAGCNYTAPVVATPWYMSPVGMIGIALALGLGYFIIKK